MRVGVARACASETSAEDSGLYSFRFDHPDDLTGSTQSAVACAVLSAVGRSAGDSGPYAKPRDPVEWLGT
jgi:hypothetical protein